MVDISTRLSHFDTTVTFIIAATATRPRIPAPLYHAPYRTQETEKDSQNYEQDDGSCIALVAYVIEPISVMGGIEAFSSPWIAPAVSDAAGSALDIVAAVRAIAVVGLPRFAELVPGRAVISVGLVDSIGPIGRSIPGMSMMFQRCVMLRFWWLKYVEKVFQAGKRNEMDSYDDIPRATSGWRNLELAGFM
ncbi:hypothetical protein VCV18_004672 [Metarhizium anisopliae]